MSVERKRAHAARDAIKGHNSLKARVEALEAVPELKAYLDSQEDREEAAKRLITEAQTYGQDTVDDDDPD